MTKNKKIAAAVIDLLLIPLAVVGGLFLPGEKKYYLISLAVIVLSMIPFFLIFESKKPKTSEMAVIAAMCAIGVAGRCAFFMLPQFKPVAAIIIISGACLGAESGFLIGALTAFVSNFFFGQGPWTPWQMFCLGLIGFLAGLLFARGRLKTKRIPLSIYGFLSVLVIYGGVINFSSALMTSPELTPAVLGSFYISGLPFDLIHAGATFIFLLLIGEPLAEKLERVKIKYGIFLGKNEE